MKTGKTISGTVVRSGSYGVYLQTPKGILGFVDAQELSWSHSVVEHLIPPVGSRIDAVVTRVFSERQRQGHSFVASVRALNPSLDPWSATNRYAPGESVCGTVSLVGDSFALVELASKAIATVHPSPNGLQAGQRLEVVILSVNPEKKSIAARVRGLS